MNSNIFQGKSWGFLESIASSLLLSEYEFEGGKNFTIFPRKDLQRIIPHLDHVQPVGGEVGPVNTNQVQQHLQQIDSAFSNSSNEAHSLNLFNFILLLYYVVKLS